MIDRCRSAMEKRGNAAGSNDGHQLVPLGPYPSDHSLDKCNMPPKYTRLHCADCVVSHNEPRALQRDSWELRGSCMQRLHGQVDAWRNYPSLEGAISADYIKCYGSAAVD